MDRAIGTLRGYLAREGLRENTLVFYCGDNGTPPSGLLRSPHRGRKGQVYEGGIRVPGIIEWPGRIREESPKSMKCDSQSPIAFEIKRQSYRLVRFQEERAVPGGISPSFSAR